MRPDERTVRPNVKGRRPWSDPLSDVLRSVRLVGGVFLEARFTAPWCVAAQIGVADCQPFMANLVQVIGYHVVIEGSMLVALDGEPPMESVPAKCCCFRAMTSTR